MRIFAKASFHIIDVVGRDFMNYPWKVLQTDGSFVLLST